MRFTGRAARRWCSTVVGVAIAVAVTSGRVEASSESDDLIKKGIEERRQGHDQRALELFKEAHAIDHGARSQAQMGLAEQALGLWVDAESHINAALAQDKDPWIQKNRDVIRKALEFVTSHLASLEVWGTPEGAEVLIGGRSAGALPLSAPLRITTGTVPITVRANGYLEMSRVIQVAAGGNVRERFDLPPSPTPVPAIARAADPAPSGRGDPQLLATHAADAPAPAESPVYTRWWFWTLIGAAAAGGVAAFLLTRPGDDCATGSTCTTIGPH